MASEQEFHPEDEFTRSSRAFKPNPDWDTESPSGWKSPEIFLSHSEANAEIDGKLNEDVFDDFNPSELLTGKIIGGGKYKILNLLGEGAMAVVYEAIEQATKRKVAAKTLKYTEDTLTARFAREVQIHKQLKHRNIVEAIECVQETNQLCIFIMELLDGRDLEELLEEDEKVEDFQLYASILAQLCDGLEHAHQKGIIHRDLKPENIIMMKDGGNTSLKILDFGVAKIQEDLQKLTKTGLVLGSPAYMSPEQCMGLKLTEKSDIYSVGVLAFELVTGELPYDATTAVTMMDAHCNPTVFPSKIAEHRPETPAADILQGIINACLHYEPDMRYKNMNLLKADLHEWWMAAKFSDDENKSPFHFSFEEVKNTEASEQPVKQDFRALSELVENQRKSQYNTLKENFEEGDLPRAKIDLKKYKSLAIAFGAGILIAAGIAAISFVALNSQTKKEQVNQVEATTGEDTASENTSDETPTGSGDEAEELAPKGKKKPRKIIAPGWVEQK